MRAVARAGGTACRRWIAGAAMVFEGGSAWLTMALDAIAATGAALRGTVVQKHTVSREGACLWAHRRCVAVGAPATPSRDELVRALAIVQSAIVET